MDKLDIKKVAVVILNYKSWKDTIKEAEICSSLLHIDYHNIIIVDNCSPNESYKELKKEAEVKKFVLIKSNSNQGYASGNNIGLRYAFKTGYDYAWILNNDIIIDDEKILVKMLEVFEKDKTVATVNPDVFSPDGHMFNRDSIRPSFFDMTFGLLKYKFKGRIKKDLGGYGYVYRPQGCCFLADLDKMQQVNYMDENTFLYCEEIILAERLLNKEYHCACCSAQIIHNHSKTVKSVFDKSKIIKMNNNSYRYYLQQYRHFSSFKVFVCLLFNYLKLTILN